MRVVFRCKRSGNTVSFTHEDDIAGLRKHEGYEEVVCPPVTSATPEPETTQMPDFLKPTEEKRRGRPRKG